MDGTLTGFDADCLLSTVTPKDYIAIPFAVVPGAEPHSLFCLKSLDKKELTCKKVL